MTRFSCVSENGRTHHVSDAGVIKLALGPGAACQNPDPALDFPDDLNAGIAASHAHRLPGVVRLPTPGKA